jgi:hypothetical protein
LAVEDVVIPTEIRGERRYVSLMWPLVGPTIAEKTATPMSKGSRSGQTSDGNINAR